MDFNSNSLYSHDARGKPGSPCSGSPISLIVAAIMDALRSHRLTHYLLLAAVLALTTLPNLGATSLWDMDEGVNAECSREMMEIGTWVVPTYNYDLRTAKPVMLYWLQRASYNLFGVSEWAWRFPSVLMALGTVLLVYELGRNMFAANVGLFGGIVLASNLEFVKLAHAATPDATFIFFATLTLVIFWFGQLNGGRAWFVPAAVSSALAVLTKGPVGVALPGLVILLFLAWNRELNRLLDRRMLWGILAFLLVAVPWFGLVAAETRGAYIRAFFGNDNVNRFLSPMENHRGPIFYYVGAILIFFAPWSIVIGPTIWSAMKSSKESNGHRAHRFLLLWVLAYLVFFSFAATKLPNYIAPLYPALALLTANFLHRWANGTLPVARWVMPTAASGMAVIGIVVIVGLLIVGGAIFTNLKGLRLLPDLAPWAALGLLPLGCAIAIDSFFPTATARPRRWNDCPCRGGICFHPGGVSRADRRCGKGAEAPRRRVRREATRPRHPPGQP